MLHPPTDDDDQAASLRSLGDDEIVLEKESMVSTVGGSLHVLDDLLNGVLRLECFGSRVAVEDFSSGGSPGIDEGGKVVLVLRKQKERKSRD